MPHAPDLSGIALDDRYELHALIGEGAFGRVYRGIDRRLARPVAVKVIKPWWAEDPAWAQTFERETQILARVSDPGIVQIYDVGHAPEGLYYVAELIDGEDLAVHLRAGPLPPWRACAIATQLCRALARAHRQRVVHRDIKPANILLSRRGEVKVGDFGVARMAEGSTDGAAATIVGTPRYMAPEQGRGLETSAATDVYSVGVVLYEMLAGRPPFAGNSPVELALAHDQDPPPLLNERVPQALRAIVVRALAKDPAQRFADGAEMAAALTEARRDSAAHPRRAAAPATGHSERSRPAGATALLTPAVQPRTAAIPARAARAATHAAADDDRTRRSPRGDWRARRDVDPPGRRRALAAVGIVAALLAAMAVGAAVLGSAHTRVPRLVHLTRTAAFARLRAGHLKAAVTRRYDRATAGTVVAQRPGAGTRVAPGTRVRLVLSRGRAPVPVPVVDGAGTAPTVRAFAKLGLRTSVTAVPAPAGAPGTAPGTVLRTSPAAGQHARAGSTVALFVAETPQWRPLTTVTTSEPVAFTIRGTRWRIVYRMAYQGTCTWIFFCSGPNAHVLTSAGTPVRSFGLSDGGPQTETFERTPQTYRLRVTPGGDSAKWSMEIEDYY